MSSLAETRLRGVGQWLGKNFRFKDIPSATGRLVRAYRAKYVTCKNARMTPFFHFVAFAMVLNYFIEYKHLKTERLRKYH